MPPGMVSARPGGPRTGPQVGKGRLSAIDVVRVVTMFSVVVVHSLSMIVPEDDKLGGAVLAVFHSSREVFLLLSALVLTYSASRRPLPPRGFWQRRFPLVMAPYVTWTVLYMIANGDFTSPSSVVNHLAFDLATGAASYHLYFLLLTFQMYLIFPWLLKWVTARAGRPMKMLAVSAAVQLAFTTVAHYHLPVPPPLSWLAAHPGSWLPSYQLYVIAGIVIGLRTDDITAWCSKRAGRLAALAGAVVAGSIGLYALEVDRLGTKPLVAADVFAPTVVLVSLALGAAELGAGQRWAQRASAKQLRRAALWADLSFGIYLFHPMLLRVAIDLGVRPATAALPSPVAVALVVLVGAPLLMFTAGSIINLARPTPLSLVLTGRPQQRRKAPAVDTPSTATREATTAPPAPAALSEATAGPVA